MPPQEYKKIKLMKQQIKSIPEKETSEFLLKSSFHKPDFGYDLDGYNAMMSLMMLKMIANRRRH